MNWGKSMICSFVFYVWFSCHSTSGQAMLFKEISSSCGMNTEENSYGIAFGDFNQDGREDLYVTSRLNTNRLYENQGNDLFIENASNLNLAFTPSTRTAVWFDLNNDYLLDLVLGNDNTLDELYLQSPNGFFENITLDAGVFNKGNTFSINIADVNQDNFLDIYCSNFLGENNLFINNQDNTFTDLIYQFGAKDDGKSMGSIFFDYDKDGDADLYLVHDNRQPNILYENQGGKGFVDVSVPSGTNYAGLGMGVDVGDINNDGWLDIYITNLYENTLLLNNQDGTFKDISASAQVQDYGMGWGTTFLDVDNDGWVDIYACNDSYFSDYPNILYRNNKDLTFTPIAIEEPVSSKQGSYACVCGDINLDGKVDIAVGNAGQNDYTQIFLNEVKSNNNWIGFKLNGTTSNTTAIGSKIRLVDNLGVVHYDEITGGNGFAGQSSLMLHFGLGLATEIDSVTIIWANAEKQSLTDLKINQYYQVLEGSRPELLSTPDQTTALGSIVQQSSISIFPNPVQRELNFSLELAKNADVGIKIWDVKGRLIHQTALTNKDPGAHHWRMELPKLSNHELILAELQIEEQKITKKIIVGHY